MLTLGIVHSMIHTLLLALSASGRSVDVHEQWALSVVRQSIASSVQASADKYAEKSVGIAHKCTRARNAHPRTSNIHRVFFVLDVHSAARMLALPGAYNHTLWDAPAKNATLRSIQGSEQLIKIRKTFTICKEHTSQTAYLLTVSTPPDDYDSSRASA
ncbi:MAG: hypothetical protein JNN25_11955 [Candidatus Kapabacteria bacterium]|nr:hypothetical protein [Candidatus Kapabacteria bacterium]